MRALRDSREFWLYPQSCSHAEDSGEGTGTEIGWVWWSLGPAEIRWDWWSLDPDALQDSWSIMVVGKPEIKQE